MLYTEIKPENIAVLVDHFYKLVRKDETLGAIFHRIVGTDDESWEHHLDNITRFWSSVILRTNNFQGQPMLAHLRIPDLKVEHFDIWLALFHRTANKLYDEACAKVFRDVSTQIGSNFARNIHARNLRAF